MRIQIIGPEKDQNFKKLLQNILHAIHELQIEATVDEVTDLRELPDYPLTLYPALYVNGELMCQGKCLTLEQVRDCLRRHLTATK